MKVGIGPDHGGFEMKQQLAKVILLEAARISQTRRMLHVHDITGENDDVV